MKIFSLLDQTKFKFLFFGFINTVLTNLLLQIGLLFFSTVKATFISQMFNFLFGYYIYAKKVFKVSSLELSFFGKYLFLTLLVWNFSWLSIDYLNTFGLSKNLTAILIIPPFALFSYCVQKHYVFKN